MIPVPPAINDQILKSNIAYNIRYLRYSTYPRMSQAALANKLGTARTNVRNYENALHFPPVYILAELSELFHISTDSLIFCRLPQERKEGIRTNENITYKHPETNP